MVARNLNLQCEDCRNADSWGRSCALNALYPIVLLMNGRLGQCPDFCEKTREQFARQAKDRHR